MSDLIELLKAECQCDETQHCVTCRAADEIDRLRRERKCSVCAGDGVPVSGGKCICGGSGLESDEISGLRRELAEAREDAERYRQIWKDFPMTVGEMIENTYGSFPVDNKDQGDAAIDAARAANRAALLSRPSPAKF